MSVPLCATTCPVVGRFVIEAARAGGAGEGYVRQASGITATEQSTAAVLRAVLAEMPNTSNVRGWLVARLHQLEHNPEEEA